MLLIKGLLFTIIYIGYMYVVGAAFTEKKGSYSKHLIVGYIIFSFLVAIGGIPIQILNLPFAVFSIYLLIVIVGLLAFAIFYAAAKHVRLIDLNNARSFLSTQWFVLLIAVILTIAMVCNIPRLWDNNKWDDGYYLGLVATLPYPPNTFYTNPATGVLSSFSNMKSYLVNTYYSELAAYVYWFGFKTTMFCRIFINFINYYLFASMITLVAEYFMRLLNVKVREYVPQFASWILLLFGLPSAFLESSHILFLQDDWQFNTAMFYGSSIVRCMGIFLLILPFLEKREIQPKDICIVIFMSFVLISKSTIALPLIILTTVAYLISYLVCNINLRNGLLAAVIILLYFLISLLLNGNHDAMQTTMDILYQNNIHSWLLIPSFILFITSFFYRNKNIIQFNITLVLIVLMMCLPIVRNVFYTFSFMNFVVGRAFTNWVYTYLCACSIYLLIDTYHFIHQENLRILIPTTASACLTIWLFSRMGSLPALGSAFKTLYDNPLLTPASTVQIGKDLEDRYSETGKENVMLVTEAVKVNGWNHLITGSIRTESPHTMCLSAELRFKTGDGYFKEEDQKRFYEFICAPDQSTWDPFSSILDKYHINMLVVQSDVGLNKVEYQPFMDQGGFLLYDIIKDDKADTLYYIYVRDNA